MGKNSGQNPVGLGVLVNSRQELPATSPTDSEFLAHEHSSKSELGFLLPTVASRDCVMPPRKGETNGPLVSCCGSQGWRNPGNGLVIDPAINAYVPVTENKPYLAAGCSDS